MPQETATAVAWALQQVIFTDVDTIPVTVGTPHFLVDKVREYFNTNSIEYNTFSYDDLVSYLPE